MQVDTHVDKIFFCHSQSSPISMFGKIVAISTVKPVSQNYASATGSARVVKSIYFWSGTKYFKRNTADFHKDGYFLQNAGVTKDLRIAFVVCDVNSEKEQLQVKIFVAPVRACVAPVCDFKSEVEELPMIDFLGLVGEM